MNIFTDILKIPLILRNWITYQGYTGTPLPPPKPEPLRRKRPEVIEGEGELVMWEIDPRTRKVRFAAVRKERKQS